MRFVDTTVLLNALSRAPAERDKARAARELMQAALRAKSRFGITCWAGAVVEAERDLSCRILLTEDLSDGQDYDGVVVQNPFSRID